jgi:hypothetical protein
VLASTEDENKCPQAGDGKRRVAEISMLALWTSLNCRERLRRRRRCAAADEWCGTLLLPLPARQWFCSQRHILAKKKSATNEFAAKAKAKAKAPGMCSLSRSSRHLVTPLTPDPDTQRQDNEQYSNREQTGQTTLLVTLVAAPRAQNCSSRFLPFSDKRTPRAAMHLTETLAAKIKE